MIQWLQTHFGSFVNPIGHLLTFKLDNRPKSGWPRQIIIFGLEFVCEMC